VTRGNQEPKESPPRTLAVLQLRVDLSHSPKIIQAADGGDGTELDVSTLTGPATLRGGFWPHIANGQRVWMSVKGIKKDGTEYKRVVWTGPNNAVNGTWISQKYLDATVSLVDMQSLKNLSQLLVTFMTTLDRSTDESQALSFPVRTYTVKNLVEVLPTITSIKESPGGEEIPHGSPTVKTAVTLSGTATPDTKIDLANNGVLMPNTEIEVDPKGEWTFQLTGLVAGTTYKISARRKDGTLSDARDIVVVALVVPTLDNVLDDKGVEVPDGKTTVSNTLKLKGTASYGQKVEIFDGNGASAESKGIATADDVKGTWERTITVALGTRRLYAKSLYHSGSIYSGVRNLTIIPSLQIDPSRMELDGVQLYLAPAPYTPPFERTAFRHPNTSQTRFPTGGTPPYEYTTSNLQVATVDLKTGLVVSTGNGTAQITVTDTAGASVSFPVRCQRVYEVVTGPPKSFNQGIEWLRTIGAYHFAHMEWLRDIGISLHYGYQQITGQRHLYWYWGGPAENESSTQGFPGQATGRQPSYPSTAGFGSIATVTNYTTPLSPLGYRLRNPS
jgi:hypothetical protein